jgi:chromatin segregation and condensation protein Rec8/ScpA/Scc1 (kleisin family)
MALLELVKQRNILISQDDAYSEVRIYPGPVAPVAAPEAAAPAAPQPAAVQEKLF